MSRQRNSSRFPGGIALVVGAGGGIGRALCPMLAAAGCHVIAADLRRESIPDDSGAAETVSLDATDDEAVTKLLADVGKRFGRIDVLVHAAGVVGNEPFPERDVADIRAELDLNLLSPLTLIRRALPLLEAGRLNERVRSHVVVLGSLGGVLPMPGQSIYAASKFGLRGALLSLGMSLRERGIAVTDVLPSAVDTPMLHKEVAEDGNATQFLGTPLTPEDVGRRIMDVLGRHRAELHPNRLEFLGVHLLMAAPGALRPVLSVLDRLGRRGMARYRAELERRGDLPQSGAETPR